MSAGTKCSQMNTLCLNKEMRSRNEVKCIHDSSLFWQIQSLYDRVRGSGKIGVHGRFILSYSELWNTGLFFTFRNLQNQSMNTYALGPIALYMWNIAEADVLKVYSNA